MAFVPAPRFALFALLTAFAASAQSRGPVIPNYQDPSKQAPAAAPAPAAKSDDIDLVGPTEKQQARAKAAAEAKAKAEADAKVKAEAQAKAAAEAKAKAEVEAKARAEAEVKAKAEADAKARAEAEAQAKAAAEVKAAAEKKAQEEAAAKAQAEANARAKAAADAEAARLKTIEDSKARAAAATEAAKQKALDAVLAQRRAAEQAHAAAQAAAEAKRAAREQMLAAEREEAKARKAEAEAKAQARALQAARKREEAKCGKGRKAQACLDAVAAKYDGPPQPLPSLADAPPAAESLAIAPLVASPPAAAPVAEPQRAVAMPGSPTPPPPARPLETLAAGDRKVLLPPTAAAKPQPAAPQPARAAVPAVASAQPAPVRVASATPAPMIAPPPPAVASSMIAVPRDEQQRQPRSAEVVNDLQIGPQSLILDRLQARGDIIPGGIQLEFGYRLAVDDATAAHHMFSLGVTSARCQAGDACGLRWFLRGGLGPRNSNNFGVERTVNGVNVAQTDSLSWAANVFQAGIGYSGASFFGTADVQAEGLADDYAQNVKSSNPPQVHASLQQWRIRGAVGLQRGAFTGQLRVAGYAYGGANTTADFKNVPVRGALVEDDLPGLAGALQSFSARAEGSYLLRASTDVSASYGFISYAGPTWSSANIFAASVGQKLGRFRLALGLVYELEQDAQGNSYPTVFGTGSLGASF